MAAAGIWNIVMCWGPNGMDFGLSLVEEWKLSNVSADITISILRENETEDDSCSCRSSATDRQTDID
jgi:hypothetical protein